ncbi:hypothetical protein C0Q70_15823 [Pomacea canaliculata]|uniref:Uncharacterized protein n=1 Tax=Pomacea canaliculata TaxID=400727 RepID=A0A2T7NVX8_POMCA|nr:hypothetical protein C0Q70_15823 [Pomacea canaliculata]
MDFTDNPNERDSSNPTSTPPEEAEDEGPADSLSFTLVVIACAFIGFLILIISLSVTWNTRQNSDIRLCGLEEGLPRSCLSSQSEDQPLQVQPAQDSQVQGLPEAQGLLQAETSRDSNVTRRRRTQHVTWNASVLGGDDYCDAAAGASDDAVEYISMDQLAEHPRASATQAPPSASPCDEELYQQDECAHSGRADSGSRHATLRDADACSGAANEPDVCRRPIVVDEGDYVTLIGLPAQPEAENSANAQGPLEAASDLRDAQAQGGEFLAEQSSMSVRITREELRRLQRQQQNIEDDIEEDGEQEGHGDKEVAHLTSSEEESLDEESLGEAQGGELLAEQSSMSVRITREELRRLQQLQRLQRQQQNIEDDNDEDDEQEGHGDKEATDRTSSEEEWLDDDQLTQEHQQLLRRRQNSDEDDKDCKKH